MLSMTGCGKADACCSGWNVAVEVKSVNHRFLDIGMRLPRNLSFLEEPVRREISKQIRRGHVEVFITVKSSSSANDIIIDEELMERYVSASRKLAAILPNSPLPTIAEMMQLPDAVRVEESAIDEEAVKNLVLDALDDALSKTTAMRKSEGVNLHNDILLHLNATEDIRNEIQLRAPKVAENYRVRLVSRLESWQMENIDEARIAQEVALLADKCAIDEELSRLSSHIGQMKNYLDARDDMGKKMDFLVQEMNREANTIGSKAQDAEIAQLVVNMKSEIEKMREQIQNVE